MDRGREGGREGSLITIFDNLLIHCSKDHGGNMALPLCKAGFTVSVIGYDLAPQATLTQIVDECCRAVAFIVSRHPCAQLVIGGHSCGAQLAASLMYARWEEYGLMECPVKGMLCFARLELCVDVLERLCTIPTDWHCSAFRSCPVGWHL